jgi:hypothetical protein
MPGDKLNENRLRILENLHIPLWLIKDTCWMMQWKLLGACMITPTLLVAFIITYRTRKHPLIVYPNLAICVWIMANSLWMCEEFFGWKLKCYSPYFFGLGFVFVGIYAFHFIRQYLRHNRNIDKLEM